MKECEKLKARLSRVTRQRDHLLGGLSWSEATAWNPMDDDDHDDDDLIEGLDRAQVDPGAQQGGFGQLCSDVLRAREDLEVAEHRLEEHCRSLLVDLIQNQDKTGANSLLDKMPNGFAKTMMIHLVRTEFGP